MQNYFWHIWSGWIVLRFQQNRVIFNCKYLNSRTRFNTPVHVKYLENLVKPVQLFVSAIYYYAYIVKMKYKQRKIKNKRFRIAVDQIERPFVHNIMLINIRLSFILWSLCRWINTDCLSNLHIKCYFFNLALSSMSFRVIFNIFPWKNTSVFLFFILTNVYWFYNHFFFVFYNHFFFWIL